MITTADFKNGISVVIGGILYQLIEFQHIKPGKGGAFVRTRLRNMRTKAVVDKTFRAGEKIEDAYIETKKMQYTYHSGNTYHFMDSKTFEEVSITESVIGDNKKFLKEGIEITSLWHKAQIIDISLPAAIILKITHSEPGIRGDTARQAFKPATLETGAVVQVPLFVNAGDAIKVDTRTGEYLERA
ncbi:MAG: elongation factor P [Candidatus Omnitrophica bacterium]|nr:elongation factor P [Candidatus Omnitrophota bacterium]